MSALATVGTMMQSLRDGILVVPPALGLVHSQRFRILFSATVKDLKLPGCYHLSVASPEDNNSRPGELLFVQLPSRYYAIVMCLVGQPSDSYFTIVVAEDTKITILQATLTVCWLTQSDRFEAQFNNKASFFSFIECFATAGIEVEKRVLAATEELWTFERTISLLASTSSVTIPRDANEVVIHRDSNSRIDSLFFGALSIVDTGTAESLNDIPPPYSPAHRHRFSLADLYLTHGKPAVRFVGAVAAGVIGGGIILTLTYVLGIGKALVTDAKML